MADKLTIAECAAFLNEELTKAERNAHARDQAAECYSSGTTAEWRAAADLHPSTRGQRVLTKKERLEMAQRERRIAEKYQRSAALYRATLEHLNGAGSQEPD